jgi:hypothetical protein
MLRADVGKAPRPRAVEGEIHHPLLVALVEHRVRAGQIGAVDRDLALDGDVTLALAAFHHGQLLDIRSCGIPARDEAEGQFRRRAEQALDAAGVLHARQFDQNAARTLPRDHGLVDAGLVNAAPDDGDGLLDRVGLHIGDRCVGQAEHQSRALDRLRPDRPLRRCSSPFGQEALQRGRSSRSISLAGVLNGDILAGDAYTLRAQTGHVECAGHLAAGGYQPLIDDGLHVRLEQEVGAALEVEAQVYARLRHPGW